MDFILILPLLYILVIWTTHLFSRVTIPDAVLIQFVLLKMSTIVLETCRGV